MSQQDLKGKVVIVTGAGSGLGEATARAFGAQGCTVAVLDIRQEAADRVSKDLVAQDVSSIAIKCDVSSPEGVFSAVEQVVKQFGRVDVVVNNAAVDHTVSVDEMTVEQFDQVLGVNLRGPFLFAKATLPIMRQQKYGHFINIASTAALRAWGNASAYHATKWGIVGWGRGLGVEGRPDNIRVTTMIPGGMNTHFFDRFVDQGIPMPDPTNLQDPANVARAIVFAVQMPDNSVVQEMMVMPMTETSWP
jgi:NAD(P)-dependent dehydrogenase (short-subunit alcohol dehydrogenase family)